MRDCLGSMKSVVNVHGIELKSLRGGPFEFSIFSQRTTAKTSFRCFSGMNPENLAGSRTGVWMGVSGSESREVLGSDPETTEGYAMTGCCTSMFANRISYFFDLKGAVKSNH